MIPLPPLAPVRDWPAFVDTECFWNYWLLKIRPKGGQVITFALRHGECFTPEQVELIRHLLETYCVITFFGKGYDIWTTAVALMHGTPENMKTVSDKLIKKDPYTGAKTRGWELGLGECDWRNHIDVAEVCPGAGSQKQYAGRTHAKTMRDLPYDPDDWLTETQIEQIDRYCENDLDVLEHLYNECAPLLKIREKLSARYGLDLRSKSDAQLAEAVLKVRCEQALGQKLYKPRVPDFSPLTFRVPSFISYQTPELNHALDLVRSSIFQLDGGGNVMTPEAMQNLVINIGKGSYKIGVGGLHSQEKCISYRADEHTVLRDIDVASYYPSLIINSGEFPPALGQQFQVEYAAIKAERLAAKDLQKALESSGRSGTPEWVDANSENEGGKVGINGTFGKTGSAFSILFAPQMLLQTTLTGQLSLLMLIEWHEAYGIPIIQANTDGIVMACPKHLLDVSKFLVTEWEKRTGLQMEETYYKSIHSRDVNNYFAVKTDGKLKRKGEYAKASFIDKKNPDVEVCSDAVAAFLATGAPIDFHIMRERDVRKFVTVQKVDGGAYKMWGEQPHGNERVADMEPRLVAKGWTKRARGRWVRPGDPAEYAPGVAFESTFELPRPEYLGKVVRWYYGTRSPGPIVYSTRKAKVQLSYGAQPCMTLPDTLPCDIDYQWYMRKARDILNDVGYRP